MLTKILLVRHGETEWNKLGKFQGCKDISLSEEGIVQAQYVSKSINGNFDYLFTSPLKRAVQTAGIIGAERKIKPIVINDIREINFGEWEGLTVKEIAGNFSKQFEIWKTDKTEGPICGGELSIKNACTRAKNVITEVANKYKGKKSVIVAHGGIIKAGLIGIFDWDMTMYHKMALGNTAISEIAFDSDMSPLLLRLNDTSHLPKDYVVKSYV